MFRSLLFSNINRNVTSHSRFRVMSTSAKDSTVKVDLTNRESRAARRAQVLSKQSKDSNNVPRLALIAALGITVASVYECTTNPKGQLGTLYYESSLGSYLYSLYQSVVGRLGVEDIFQPSFEKLLPDWPDAPCYGNPPPGTPAPPLLVIDLEKTLVGSVFDVQYGWRHVKRPGLDKFINALSQYYEIVIFSENDIGISQDILMAIDPEGKCHKLGSAHAELRGTTVVKRLDLMNRDLSRIILIDDNPDSFQLFPRNTLQVKPFTDIHNKHDTVLLDLIPLLQAFIHEDKRDFRDTIDDLGTHEAEEAVLEYRMRLSEKRASEERKRNRGLGGLIRGKKEEKPDDFSDSKSSVLSPSQIVGESSSNSKLELLSNITGNTFNSKNKSLGPVVKKKGALLEWFENSDKEKAENQMRKNEKMNEIYNKKQMEKAQKEQEEREKQNY